MAAVLTTFAASLVLLMAPPVSAPKASSEKSDAPTSLARAKRTDIETGAARKAFLAGLVPTSRARRLLPTLSLFPSIDVEDAIVRSGPCPSGMVMIGRTHCIDVYEAALVQMMPDG